MKTFLILVCLLAGFAAAPAIDSALKRPAVHKLTAGQRARGFAPVPPSAYKQSGDVECFQYQVPDRGDWVLVRMYNPPSGLPDALVLPVANKSLASGCRLVTTNDANPFTFLFLKL